jgi:hypothetical protein
MRTATATTISGRGRQVREQHAMIAAVRANSRARHRHLDLFMQRPA